MSAIRRTALATLDRLVVVLAALVLTAACRSDDRSAVHSPAESVAVAPSFETFSPPAPRAPGAPAPMASPPSAAGAAASVQQPPASPTRKVIRNGNQTIEVESVDVALDAIRRAVSEFGGYTTDESQRQDDNGRKVASITCRIPAEKLDQATARFRELGTQEALNVTAQDITEAYSDLEIQVANQKRLEARLLDLLNRQANRLSDLLEIEREAARVRGEIDRMEGRKRFWDNQLALSTLVVTAHEPEPVIASAGGGPWRTLRNAFSDAGDNFVLTIAAIISAAGALIPLGIAVVFLIIGVQRWRRRRRAAKAQAQHNQPG